jgi:peptidoglycan/xylan/chitin deacetylase (PgdA/CDA1 family)
MRPELIARLRSVARVRRRPARGGPLILLYHRVAHADTDPQALAITPERFDEHLSFIEAQCEPVALRDLVAAVHDGGSTGARRAVAVTFDDGYADNLSVAKPLLERTGVPATVFVASGYVRAPKPFWWDELERVLLRAKQLPPTLDLEIEGENLRVDLGDGTAAAGDGWTVLRKDAPTPRHAAYRDLCARLRMLDEAERESTLQVLTSLVDAENGESAHSPRPLTADELARLAEGDLIDVGAHTVSHPVLAELPRGRQEDEIASGKEELEEILGRPVASFAYPYGGGSDFDATTVSLVRAAGFDHACTALAGVVTSRTNRFRLPRIVVRNCTPDELEQLLSRVPS